MIKKKKKK